MEAFNSPPPSLTNLSLNLSPAVSEWQIRLEEGGNGPKLALENLADIRIHVRYRHGHPARFEALN